VKVDVVGFKTITHNAVRRERNKEKGPYRRFRRSS